MDPSLYVVNTLNQLDCEQVMQTVVQTGYAAVRGLFDKSAIRGALHTIQSWISSHDDHAATGETPSDIMSNYQKLVVGGGAQRNYYVPRCVRILYNPIWADDAFQMRAMFIRLAQLRNRLIDKPHDFAIDQVSNEGFWTASRIQHYPSGGGFFAEHRDAVLSQQTQQAGLADFLQIILLLTERGIDYQTGGAYVVNQGERVDLEGLYGCGDVLLYDGRSVHGVDDIDMGEPFALRSGQGRVVALASLYEDLTVSGKNSRSYKERVIKT